MSEQQTPIVGLGAKPERNLDLWQRRKAGERWVDLARSSGVSAVRVRQIVEKVERLNQRDARRIAAAALDASQDARVKRDSEGET